MRFALSPQRRLGTRSVEPKNRDDRQIPPFAGEARYLDPGTLGYIGGDRDGPRNTDFQGGSPNIVLLVAISADREPVSD